MREDKRNRTKPVLHGKQNKAPRECHEGLEYTQARNDLQRRMDAARHRSEAALSCRGNSHKCSLEQLTVPKTEIRESRRRIRIVVDVFPACECIGEVECARRESQAGREDASHKRW